jgi:hypothetical protein
MSDRRGVRKNQLELIDSLLVSFQPGEYHTLVIEIADYVHRQGMLFEACGRVFNYLECMLIALGFDAKLGEFTVKRATYRVIIGSLGRSWFLLIGVTLNLTQSCQNVPDPCDGLGMTLQEIVCVAGSKVVELLCSQPLLLYIEL